MKRWLGQSPQDFSVVKGFWEQRTLLCSRGITNPVSGSCNSAYTDGNWGAKSWAWGRNHWQTFYAWCYTADQTRSSQPALLALKSVCLWLTWFPHYMHTSALHLVTEEERECIQLALGFLPKQGKWRFCLRTTPITLENTMGLLAFGQSGQDFKV